MLKLLSYDDRYDDRYGTFIGTMIGAMIGTKLLSVWCFGHIKTFIGTTGRYDDGVHDRYETFIGTELLYFQIINFGMKILSVQKLLSVRNFYQYETFIDGTFIGTKLLNFFLSVQWLLNFYRYNGF